MSSIKLIGRLILIGSWLLFLGLPAASGIFLVLKTPYNCFPGAACQISWDVEDGGPHNFNTVNLYLMDYSYDQLNIIHIIAEDLNVLSSNSLVWHVPLGFVADQQYFICAYDINAEYQTCSGHFWIMADYIKSDSDFNG